MWKKYFLNIFKPLSFFGINLRPLNRQSENNLISDYDESSWIKTHEKVQLLRHTAKALGEEKKEYNSAIELLAKSVEIIKNSSIFDFYYKNSKLDSCYRAMTIYALKNHDLKSALQYAKLYGHPGYLGDIYFELGLYEECLDAYTDISKPREVYPGYNLPPEEKISRAKISKVVKAFFELNKKDGFKYDVKGIEDCYGWLFEQVVGRFSSLELAYKYYNCNRSSTGSKYQNDMQKQNQALSQDELKEWLSIFKEQKDFTKLCSDKVDSLRMMINNSEFEKIERELFSLYNSAQEFEDLTNLPCLEKLDLVIAISDLYIITHNPDKAISWVKKHLDVHYKIINYYLNIKYFLNEDLTGQDLVTLGFSSRYRNNVAIYGYPKFYTPLPFAFRHKTDIIKICDKLYQEYRQSLGNPYLKYLDQQRGKKFLFSYFYQPFDGLGTGYFQLMVNQSLPMKWPYAHFDSCKEFIKFVSEINLKAENICRLSMGLSERGKGWTSENEIFAYIKDFLGNYKVKQHYSPSWLSPKHFDIYIPDLQVAIEYQGKQHYEPIHFFGGEKAFEQVQVRDKIKNRLCEEKGIKLLYVRYDDKNPEQTIQDFLENHLNYKTDKRNNLQEDFNNRRK